MMINSSTAFAKSSTAYGAHVTRMGDEKLPRKLLYPQFCEGTGYQDLSKLRFKDAMKKSMKLWNIDSCL